MYKTEIEAQEIHDRQMERLRKERDILASLHAEITSLRKANTLLLGTISTQDAEIARLLEAKRRALAVADERSKENVALRAALLPFADQYDNLERNGYLGSQLLLRRNGEWLGHSAVQEPEFKAAREALGK